MSQRLVKKKGLTKKKMLENMRQKPSISPRGAAAHAMDIHAMKLPL